jgi:hypothetical protein
VHETPLRGRWDVSWGGRTPWQTLKTFDWPSSVDPANQYPAYTVHSFVGHFNDQPGMDLLMVDYSRQARIFDRAAGAFVPHGEYAW